VVLVRPLLAIPKARLVATLARAGIASADDLSNRDPRFLRARLRGMMPALAREGLDAPRLALLARRLARAEIALERAVDAAAAELSVRASSDRALCDRVRDDRALDDRDCGKAGPMVLDAEKFLALPAEIALRLLGRTIVQGGDAAPLRLGKLEALHGALVTAKAAAGVRLRRTLAGALVTLTARRLVVERAPPRSRRENPRKPMP
jgi:tRNA(Ile)-lysidine synthase